MYCHTLSRHDALPIGEREPWSLVWLLCRCDFPSRGREGGLLFRVDEDDFGVVDRGDGDGLAARQRRTVAGIEANAVDLDRARRGDEIGVPPLADAVRQADRKSTRLNSSHYCASRMPSSA